MGLPTPDDIDVEVADVPLGWAAVAAVDDDDDVVVGAAGLLDAVPDATT